MADIFDLITAFLNKNKEILATIAAIVTGIVWLFCEFFGSREVSAPPTSTTLTINYNNWPFDKAEVDLTDEKAGYQTSIKDSQ